MSPLDGLAIDYRPYLAPEGIAPVSLLDAPSLGAGLRAARERSGRSLEALSNITRVRRDYLAAIEEGAFDRLPSRPFAIGYVRAYASTLGLDEEIAAELFKKSTPERAAPLQAPTGADMDDAPRRPWWALPVAALAIACVVGWNIEQRVVNARHAAPASLETIRSTWTLGDGPAAGAIQVDAPRPAPADQTTPAPYVTPGLEVVALSGPADPNAPLIDPSDPHALAKAEALVPATPTVAANTPPGSVYGVDAARSAVTLKARKPAYLVVRGADDRVYFARQLAAGEAYRLPADGGLRLEVSDPLAFDKYEHGQWKGVLSAASTALADLNAEAAAAAAPKPVPAAGVHPAALKAD